MISFTFILLLSTLFIGKTYSQKTRSNYPNFDFDRSFSTKTPYWDQSDGSMTTPVPEKCQSVQLNVVSRHGTRFPTRGSVLRMRSFFEKVKQYYGHAPPSWFKEWDFPYTLEKSGDLVARGEQELAILGEWIRKAHPHLAPEGIEDTNNYLFESTHKIRTRQSALAFIRGFYDAAPNVTVSADPEGKDFKLRFDENCPLWKSKIDSNKTATIEYSSYLKEPHMKSFIKKLPKMLLKNGGHSTSDTEFTPLDFDTAYSLCSYDMALKKDWNSWCSLFNGEEEMLRWMDFYKDVKYYWRRGFGYNMNWEISTPLLRDLFSSMESFINESPNAVKGHFRFGHSQTLFPLLTMLQVYQKDEPEVFLRTTTKEKAWNRHQKLSHIGPFGSNVVFVLYHCGSEGYKVQVLVNQQPVQLPFCGSTYCKIDNFRHTFNYYLQEYNYHKECNSQ